LVAAAYPIWDLADHPGMQSLPGFLKVGLIEEVPEGRVRRSALELQAQRLAQRISVAHGKSLLI